jgi:uncharacterized membrane protein
MASVNSSLDSDVRLTRPHIRKIGVADLKDALAKGIDDFRAMPTYSIFLIAIYPVLGLILLRLTFGYDLLPVVFPLLAGFALLGPLAAIGMYELSRRREQGLDASRSALNAFRYSNIGAIAILGAALMAVFLAWLGAALTIYEATMGNWMPDSFEDFMRRIFATHAGWALIAIGCGVGFVFAVTAFTISVVSFPMLVDRDVGAPTAVVTSIRAVIANPVTMALWGLFVAGALLVGSLPFLLGLAVVLPVLGHATWHLYRKLVEY